MRLIKSNYIGNLVLSSGKVLRPRGMLAVSELEWESLQHSSTLKTWLDAGFVSMEEREETKKELKEEKLRAVEASERSVEPLPEAQTEIRRGRK